MVAVKPFVQGAALFRYSTLCCRYSELANNRKAGIKPSLSVHTCDLLTAKARFTVGFTPFFDLLNDTFRAIVLSVFRVKDKIRPSRMFS